jgi:MFS family permease
MATNVSLGFLSPFVLGPSTLNQPKEYWALVMGAMMLGRICVLIPLGDYIVRHGARRIMTWAAVGVALVHALLLGTHPAGRALETLGASLGGDATLVGGWLTNHPTLVYVLVVQFLAGTLYAAFDLTSWLLLVRHTRDSERTSMITLCWFGFNIFGFFGTLIGTAVLAGFQVPGTGTPGTPTQFTYEGYMWVFAASTAFRLLTLVPLFTWIRRLPDE